MVSSMQAVALQQGSVFCWVLVEAREMNLDWITQQLGTKCSEPGGVRLQLVGYDSQWKNKLYDKNNKIAVCLDILKVQGSRQDFTYTGVRIAGWSEHDKRAARGQEPEWFEIHVTRSTVLNQPKRERIAATWKRIAQPAWSLIWKLSSLFPGRA